jgi:hypothetical protein
LRGAALASGEFALMNPPATAPPPTLASANSASFFFLARMVTCFCCSLISRARAWLARVCLSTASRYRVSARPSSLAIMSRRCTRSRKMSGELALSSIDMVLKRPSRYDRAATAAT